MLAEETGVAMGLAAVSNEPKKSASTHGWKPGSISLIEEHEAWPQSSSFPHIPAAASALSQAVCFFHGSFAQGSVVELALAEAAEV